MSDYPEHDKLEKIKDQSQACGEFLEWLGEKDIFLARWERQTYLDEHLWDAYVKGSDVATCLECGETCDRDDQEKLDAVTCECRREEPSLVPYQYSLNRLLAERFEIDQEKLEEEKRAMLEEMRKANEEVSSG